MAVVRNARVHAGSMSEILHSGSVIMGTTFFTE
jgi:hypothetical protein